MIPEINYLHSPDIEDLSSYSPPNGTVFGFLLQMMVNPIGESGEESFDFFICTPDWIKEKSKEEKIVPCNQMLVVEQYDYYAIVRFLTKLCESCTGDTWQECAMKLNRFGRWEFEGYVGQ